MNNFHLPSDGSVVIVDNKIQEALPLIKLLSQRGIASTYYSGANDRELPKKPIQKVRLAFFDIQLFPNSDSHTYAQNILVKLDKIISDDNGPYLLIIWSVLEDVHASTLITEVTATSFTKRPVGVLCLRKADFFNLETDDSLKNELIATIESSLRTRFSKDDLNAIKKAINESYLTNTSLIAKRNAVDVISKKLMEVLEGKDVSQLFAIWENCINKASGEIVRYFYTLHEPNEHWQNNLKASICRMAYAQLGKTIGSVKDSELIENAVTTMNHLFLDVLDKTASKVKNLSGAVKIDREFISFCKKINGKEYKIKWNVHSGKYQLYIDEKLCPVGDKGIKNIEDLFKKGKDETEKQDIKCIIAEFLSIKPEINTRLLIDLNSSESIRPGTVFIQDGIKRRRELLKNYFKDDSKLIKKDNNGKFMINNIQLGKIIFIELEVSPLCDFAQKKQLNLRLLPGIMIPQIYDNDLKNGDALYKKIPVIKIKGKDFKPVFNFLLLKTADIGEYKTKIDNTFRVKKQLLADILSRLSSHMNRIGITTIE